MSGFGLEAADEVPSETPLPVFEAQPVVQAVDLNIDARATRRTQQREASAVSSTENGPSQQTQQHQQQSSSLNCSLRASENTTTGMRTSSPPPPPLLGATARELGLIDETRAVRDDTGIDPDPGGGDEGCLERASRGELGCEVPIRVWLA
ncbi:RGP1_1 [Sanghuangporus weigelae]